MDDLWDGVTALTDASRRALYDFVWLQRHPVSREEAAEATGMSRGLAAFHLDKLVDVGLLHSHYQAPPGRPRGRGRTPKVYEPAGDGVTLTIPARRYELLAGILADAVAENPADAGEAARRQAAHRGHQIGFTLADTGHSVRSVLSRLGFSPREGGDRLLLDNCPFRDVAARHTELICGLNHAFVSGLLDGLRAAEAHAVLAPRPGACCVEVVPA